MTEPRAAAVGGLRMSYEVAGDPAAPPMVLLHALGERAADWAPVTPAFAADYRVHAVDQRGHGGSDWPGEYSFQLMRDDAIGLLDHLGLRDVVLVGHSMGAVVAYQLTIARPDLVAKLVIEDAPPPYPRDRLVPVRPESGDALPFDWPVVPAIITEVNEGSPETWAGLKMITAPTLIIGGGPDSHIPHTQLEAAASSIPDSTLITIPAGHHIHTNSPIAFQESVLTWLRP
jgi:3-oxoadipate enol-lactonase